MNEARPQSMIEELDLKWILSALLFVNERPRTVDELGLTRKDALKLVKTGYFEWKRVLYPTQLGRELAQWLLNRDGEEHVNYFEIIKREALMKMAKRGNKVTREMRILAPIHFYVMRKIRLGHSVFHRDVERRTLKELLRMELVKNVANSGLFDLTRLGGELLDCFEEVADEAGPYNKMGGVKKEEDRYDF